MPASCRRASAHGRRAARPSPDRPPAPPPRARRARRAARSSSMRGSRPSARASFGIYAQANSAPEAEQQFTAGWWRGAWSCIISAGIPAPSAAAPAPARGFRRARWSSRVSADASGPSALSSSATGSSRSADAAGECVGDVEPLRQAVDPCRLRSRKSRSAPADATAARRATPAPACTRAASRARRSGASAEMIHSVGRLSLVRCGVQDSGAATSVLAISFRLPSVSRKRSRQLVDQRRRRLVGDEMARELGAHMCAAVAGWRARSASTARPCSTPVSG